MNNIDYILELIDWNRPLSDQEKGIQMANQVRCIKAFFQPSGPGGGKSVWGNCAIIVCNHSDAELSPYVLDMLIWIQDLNWPGATEILCRLKNFTEVTYIAPLIESLLPALIVLNDYSWMQNLSELLENQSLKSLLTDSAVRTLTDISRIISDN